MPKSLKESQAEFDAMTRISASFDIVKSPLNISGRSAAYYFLQGFPEETSMGIILLRAMSADNFDFDSCPSLTEVAEKIIPFVDVSEKSDMNELSYWLFSGRCILFIDGYEGGLVIDAKKFPSRGINEPEKGRTLRGPHEGFCEQLVTNTVLIRRRLRSEKLTVEKYTVGSETRTDIAIVFMDGKADSSLLQKIRSELSGSVKALSMAQESVMEKLLIKSKKSFLNPFPKVKYTDRPDTAAAMLEEGKIIIITDNSPTVIAIPVSLFDFFESTDDYYFPPFSGTYLKLVRIFTFAASILVVPIWLMLVYYSEYLSEGLAFMLVGEDYTVPLYLQFIIIELAIDGLKLASLNTPDMLSGSLSIVGGLLLGDFAVQSGWFVTQTILYSSFTAIAGFVPSSYELGYAFKFIRVSLILAVSAAGGIGFGLGLIFWTIVIAKNKTVSGKGYAYPLFPFNKEGFLRIFVKTTSGREEK